MGFQRFTCWGFWTACYIVTRKFPEWRDDPSILPATTFWVLTACCFVGFIFVFLMVPETKG